MLSLEQKIIVIDEFYKNEQTYQQVADDLGVREAQIRGFIKSCRGSGILPRDRRDSLNPKDARFAIDRLVKRRRGE